MSIPSRCIRRPVAVAMLFLAIVLLGVISYNRLPINLLPVMALSVASDGDLDHRGRVVTSAGQVESGGVLRTVAIRNRTEARRQSERGRHAGDGKGNARARASHPHD